MAVDNGSMGKHSWEKIILGLDPGRDKTGFAFVDMLTGELLASGIFASSERDNFFEAKDFSRWIIEGRNEKIDLSRIKFLALGDGTGSKEFHDYIKSLRAYEIIIVNERNTTLEARSLYWRLHEPGFLMKLLPKSLRVPDRVLDDLAAWAIALRARKNIEI